jgi:uncharacterized integral membrane protein
MKLIKYAFWAVIALCLVVVGLANRGMVTLRAMPEALANMVGVSPDIELPLFVVIMLGIGVGLLIGFVWEWLREFKFRAEVGRKDREVQKLQREVGRMKAEKHGDEDDVLALLDGAGSRA